jgi:hypothetical protein
LAGPRATVRVTSIAEGKLGNFPRALPGKFLYALFNNPNCLEFNNPNYLKHYLEISLIVFINPNYLLVIGCKEKAITENNKGRKRIRVTGGSWRQGNARNAVTRSFGFHALSACRHCISLSARQPA